MRDRLPKIVMMTSTPPAAGGRGAGPAGAADRDAYVSEVSARLAGAGHDVEIWAPAGGGETVVEPVAASLTVRRFGGAGHPGPADGLCACTPEWVEGAASALERRAGGAPTVLVSHGWDAGAAGRELARRRGLPHVHVPHALGMCDRPVEGDGRWDLARRIREEQATCRQASRVIATTHRQRGELTGAAYAVAGKRVDVIGHGYDEGRFFPVTPVERLAARERCGFGADPVVLAVGALCRDRGFDLLIRAMRTVVRRVPTARLVLATGLDSLGETRRGLLEALRTLTAGLGLADHVVFRERIAAGELADFYRAADAFALSSRYERTGMSAVEAMACGAPAVVTSAGGGGVCREVKVGVDALCADPTDTEAFGHALCQVLRYPSLAGHLSASGARVARERFSWAGVARRFAAVVEAAAREGEAAPRRSARADARVGGGGDRPFAGLVEAGLASCVQVENDAIL